MAKEEAAGRSYLGEWHSHPYGYARPSMTDICTAARIAEEVGFPIMLLIVALDRHNIKRRSYIVDKAGRITETDEKGFGLKTSIGATNQSS